MSASATQGGHNNRLLQYRTREKCRWPARIVGEETHGSSVRTSALDDSLRVCTWTDSTASLIYHIPANTDMTAHLFLLHPDIQLTIADE